MRNYKIFSYGTLMDRRLQKLLYSREIESKDAILDGYTINCYDKYYNIIKRKGHSIKGKILYFTKDEVFYSDQWESVPLYRKKNIIAKTDDGEEEVFVYIKSEKEEGEKLFDKIDTLSNDDEFIREVEVLSKNRDILNPISDVCISYPIVEISDNRINKENIVLEDVKSRLDNKDSIQNLGMIELEFNEEFTLTCLAFINKSTITNFISFLFPVSVKNGNELYRLFKDEKINSHGKNLYSFVEENLKIKVVKSPEITIFMSKKPSENFLQDFFGKENYSLSNNGFYKLYSNEKKDIIVTDDFSVLFDKRLEKELKLLVLD